MLEIIVLLTSIALQLLAALLAIHLIRLTHRRMAWILVALALVMMIFRRLTPLLHLSTSGALTALDLFDLTGLAVSAFMVAGLVYIRQYLYDMFAAERVLRESEQRYRCLAQNIPDGAVFLFDRQRRFTLAEGPALQHLDSDKNQIEGKTVLDSPLPAEWVPVFSSMQELALAGTACGMEQAHNGRVYALEFVPIRGLNGQLEQGMCIALDITCRKKAEEDRKAAYDFLQHTIDGVAEPVMVIGLDYQVKLMNRVVRQEYDDNPEAVPTVCFALSHRRRAPCNDPAHPCPLDGVRQTLMPVTVLHEHQTTRGETRQIEIIASPLVDEHGQLQGIIEASRDITERKRAEDSLRESESIFRSFLEQSEDAIMLADETGMLIQWSKGAETLTGFSRGESLGKPVWDIQFRSAPEEYRSAEHHEHIKSTLQAALRSGKGGPLSRLVDAVIQRPDGVRRSVQTLAFAIESDKGFLLGSILRDITERKQAEAELIRLRKAVEASGEAIFMTDRDGLITFINPEFTRLYGYTSDEVVGKTTPRVLKSGQIQPEAYALFWHNILNQQVVRSELINRTKDGRLLAIDSTVNPVMNEKGEIDGFLAIQRDVSERKRAEKELDDREKRFRSLIENGVDYITLLAADGRLLWESPSAIRMLDYSENEFLETSTLELVHPDDQGWIRERLANLISRPGAQDRGVFRLRHRNGSWRWVEAIVTNLLNEPSVQAIVVNYHDVTERKQTEAEKSRLLSAIEAAVDGIAITDEKDRYIYINQAHARIYGMAQNELIGQTWRYLLPKRATAEEREIETRVNESLHNPDVGFVITEMPAWRKDGTQLPTEIRAKALWDQDGQYSGHVCNVIDITERKQAEEAVHQRAEELETLARVSATMRTAQCQDEILQAIMSQVISLSGCRAGALAMFDPAGESATVKFACGAWQDWTGQRHKIAHGITGSVYATSQPYVAADLRSQPLFEWPVDVQDIQCGACIPLITNQNMIGVLWLGRDTPLADKDLRLLTAVADMAANALQRQALHEDLQVKLRDLQQAQTQIIQSEKLAAIGQMISGIAHELNNPLTSVILYAQMMQRRSQEESVKRDLDKIVAESLRASKIVRGLLDFARQRPPESQSVNVNDILRSVIELESYELRAHNIHHELSLSPDVPLTLADAHQLQQAFVNLINNAWQAISTTQQSGHIWIQSEVARPQVPSGPEDQAVVRITIRDDGPGIPKEELSKVFDPFFTTKPEGSGTGLGLSICYGIITKHSGRIWVESEAKTGSKFIVELPILSLEHGPGGREESSYRAEASGHARILIIDDEESVLEVLTRALQGRGYTVDSLSDATGGLEKIAEFDYSTILCDVRMPGLTGPEFHRQVCTKFPALARRIVFITGDVVSPKTRSFIEEERVTCLTKPFELEELYKTVHGIERDAGTALSN